MRDLGAILNLERNAQVGAFHQLPPIQLVKRLYLGLALQVERVIQSRTASSSCPTGTLLQKLVKRLNAFQMGAQGPRRAISTSWPI